MEVTPEGCHGGDAGDSNDEGEKASYDGEGNERVRRRQYSPEVAAKLYNGNGVPGKYDGAR